MLPGGGLMAAQKSVRCVSNRMHIKQALTASIAIATFVHYAYMNRRANLGSMPRFVPLVADND